MENVAESQSVRTDGTKPKIFCFCNGGGNEWYPALAMAEDGNVLASHVCSTPGWAVHDLGLTSDWKHDKYDTYYPDGYELVWVEMAEIRTHPGLMAAYAKNQEIAREAKCEECGHAMKYHRAEYGCEVERGDGYANGSDVLQAMGPCCCTEQI